MKELSIEEKARRYDEGLDYAKSALDCLADDYICNHLTKDDIRGIYAKLFPELAESEDEKIRKELIDYHRSMAAGADDYVHETWIAWLEKQKPANVIKPKFKVGDIVRHKNFECTIESIDDTTYYCDTTNFDIKDQDDWELVEREGEEDKRIILAISQLLKDCESENGWNCVYSNDEEVFFVDIENYLQSLKNRIVSQPWSEEDINMIDWLIRCCKKEYEELCNDKYGHQDIVSELKRDCRKKWDWLEALKNRVPKKQWKPSEEQIYWLEWASNKMSDTEKGNEARAYLGELLEQLKTL